MKRTGRGVAISRTMTALVLAVTGVLQPSMAGAVGFDIGGDIQGAFDTDITYGYMRRMQSGQDDTKANSYGNRVLFPDRGDTLSNIVRVSHTLELKRGNAMGFLMRGNYFYDAAYRNKDLPTDTRNALVHSEDITDAVFFTKLGDTVTLRVGKQVINWGENTFIQGGLSDINTFDTSKLRSPGSDLKDAFVGANAIDLSWSENNWTVEGFALFAFDKVKIDAMGSPFATLDALADGGGVDLGGNGVLGGGCVAAGIPVSRCDLAGGALVRTNDKLASKSGQWGIAVRKFFPELFNGTEIGLYAQNLHDHLPSISTYAKTGLYFADYVEDIKRYGISFNTTTTGGLAVSGEYSIRKDAPIQLLAPVLNGRVASTAPVAVGSYQRGWATSDRHQAQVTLQKNWGVLHYLGADESSSILEVAVGKVNDLPAAALLLEPTLTKSWTGLQMKHSMNFQAALFNLIAVSPSLAYRWDMHGNSNEVAGKNFVGGRQALTLGLDFNYANGKYRGGIGFTNFFGRHSEKTATGSLLNGTYDRDFLQANVSMSF